MKNIGKVVEVDLDEGSVRARDPDKNIVRSFLGGRGLNVYYLLSYLNGNTNPFSPENILVFTPGLLTGSAVYSSSRLHVSSKSPLTGFLGSSNVGGDMGPMLRRNGIFSLIVLGRAERPVYLWIDSGEVQIRKEESLWGEVTSVTRERIKESTTEKASVGAIGPAGENLATMSCIMFDDGHAAGRTGMGAVMGSKKLKAIAAAPGSEEVGDDGGEDSLQDFLREIRTHPDYEEWSKYDNSTSVKWVDDLGAGTIRNYRGVQSEEIERADGRSFMDLPRTPSSCHRCPVHCKAELEVTRGPHSGEKAERPCFEPLVALGPKCGNFDSLETIQLHNACNDLGLDSVGTGGLISFAMDAFDRGILKEEDVGKLDLDWGNPEAMRSLIKQIARRDGWLGDLLADGLASAGEAFGGEAEKYAYHVKGMAMTAMDPRGFKASALGYAVGNRGGDFTSIYARLEYSFSPERAKEMFGTEKAADRFVEEGKPEVVKRASIVSAVVDSLGICKVPLLSLVEDYDLSLTADMTSAVIGEEVSSGDLLTIGERIVTGEREFNLAQGLTCEDDRLPSKFTTEEIDSGPAQGRVVDLSGMIEKFYSLMGWNTEGVPGEEKLESLGLANLVEGRRS